MAKVNGPFMSMNAKGTVGKTLTASHWKGVKTMRQCTPAANPRSLAQQSQRQTIGAAVAFWQMPTMQQNTRESWNLLARLKRKPIVGYNVFTQHFSRIMKPSELSIMVTGLHFWHVHANSFQCYFYTNQKNGKTNNNSGIINPVLIFGENPTNLVHSAHLATPKDDHMNMPTPIDTGMLPKQILYFSVQGAQNGVLNNLTGVYAVALT